VRGGGNPGYAPEELFSVIVSSSGTKVSETSKKTYFEETIKPKKDFLLVQVKEKNCK